MLLPSIPLFRDFQSSPTSEQHPPQSEFLSGTHNCDSSIIATIMQILEIHLQVLYKHWWSRYKYIRNTVVIVRSIQLESGDNKYSYPLVILAQGWTLTLRNQLPAAATSAQPLQIQIQSRVQIQIQLHTQIQIQMQLPPKLSSQILLFYHWILRLFF